MSEAAESQQSSLDEEPPGLDEAALERLSAEAKQVYDSAQRTPELTNLLANEPGPRINNPMWELVRHAVRPVKYRFLGGALEVGGVDELLRRYESREQLDVMDLLLDDWYMRRRALVRRYTWTITDPWTVQFVQQWGAGGLIDPLAGTGYWGYLLGQLGVDVLSSDLYPPQRDSRVSFFHPESAQHVPVAQMDAVKAVITHGQGRTLLLSWPPMDELATHVVQNYPGERVIFLGELGGMTGDASLIAELAVHWQEVETHLPVQFWGIRDMVHVFERTDTKDCADRKKDEEPGT